MPTGLRQVAERPGSAATPMGDVNDDRSLAIDPLGVDLGTTSALVVAVAVPTIVVRQNLDVVRTPFTALLIAVPHLGL